MFTRFLQGLETAYNPVLFRVLVSLFLLLNLLLLRNSLPELYGSKGFMNWEATRPLVFKYSITVENLAQHLRPLNVSENNIIYGLYFSFCIVSFFLLVGFLTRISAVIAWLISFILAYTSKGTFYGMHTFLQISLFYMVLLPSNRVWSVDCYLLKGLKAEKVKSFGRKLLQIHLAISYASSGWEKAVGIQWWNGEAIWRALNSGPYMQYDMVWIANYPIIPIIIGISTVALEIGYVTCIWFKHVRVIWMTLIILLHISIMTFLGLHMFGLIMIILNISAFGPEVYSDIRRLLQRRGPVKPTAVKEIEIDLTS